MSIETKNGGTFTNRQVEFIRHNIDWLAQLDLTDGEDVAYSDVEGHDVRVLDINQAHFSRLTRRLLTKVAQPTTKSAHVWQVKRGVEELVEQYAASASLCPCGHAGVRNVRGEDNPGFSCQNDDCDIRFDIETAREVWS